MTSPILVNNAADKLNKINLININNIISNVCFQTKVTITLTSDDAVKKNPYVFVNIHTGKFDDIELHVSGCEVDVAIDAVIETLVTIGQI